MNLSYIRSFDGLRALAVLLVILSHWPYRFFSQTFGWVGVNIFFVLSGFLITRILVAAKAKPFKTYLAHFYRNRALRIFPLYYAYLLAISAFLLTLYKLTPPAALPETLQHGVIAVKNDLAFLLTYTNNFLDMYHLWDGERDANDVRFFSHFWSLAVEEQYYLVFPFLVYLLPVFRLRQVLWAMAILPLFLRLGVGEYFRGTYPDYFLGMILGKLPFFHLDAFALGGILALSAWEKIKNSQYYLYLFTGFCLMVGAVSVYFLQKSGFDISYKSLGFDHPLYQFAQQNNTVLNYRYAFTFSLVNIWAVLLILTLLHKNPVRKILSMNIFTSLGRVSYGLYIFHFPLLALLVTWLETSGHWKHLYQTPWLEIPLFGAYLIISIALAWLSFRFFESRFLTFKHKTAATLSGEAA